MKIRIYCKIGTMPGTEIVLWNNKELKRGQRIFAMESRLYDSLHWEFRRKKSCQYWKSYLVMQVEGLLMLSN